MPRTQQLTRIEKLGPEIEQYVRQQLDAGAELLEIQRELQEKFGENVAYSTISNFKVRRWLREKTRIGELRDLLRAIKEEMGENAIPDSTQALILEKLNEAMTTGAALNPHFLLKEQRLWAQHTANLEKIETEKKRLELQVGNLQAQRERERAQAAEVVKSADADPETMRQRFREIYGLTS